jgi:signal peptidase II
MVPRKYLILLSASGLLVASDQLTKNLIVNRFHLSESLPVISGFFSITRVHNAGAAFGILASLPPGLREPFFFIVPGATLAAILAVFYRLRPSQNHSIYALALIVGGALGNLVDRIRLGFVVDFLDFHWSGALHFPAFNVADIAITLGVGLLFLGMLHERELEPSQVSS